MNPKVWVCQVRNQAFVGGESQRCRHSNFDIADTPPTGPECGEMELVGGEPITWCRTHNAPKFLKDACLMVLNRMGPSLREQIDGPSPCQFETQVRVGP